MGKDRTSLLGLMAPYRRAYLLGIGALVITDLLQLAIPRWVGLVTDALDRGTLSPAGIARHALGIVGLAAAVAVFRYLWRIYVFGSSWRIEVQLRERLFRHLLQLSARFFDHHKTGDLMAHATNDLQAIRMALGPGIMMLADAVVIGLGTLAVMAWTVDWRLTVLGLLPLPVLALLSWLLGRVIHRRFRQVQETFGRLTDAVQESLSGIRVIKAFVRTDHQRATFRRINHQYVDTQMRLHRVDAAFDPLIQLLTAAGFAIVVGYGGSLTLDDRISLGDFVAFVSYLGMLVWPMLAIGWMVNLWQRGSASLERIQQLLAQRPEITDAPRPAPVRRLRGRIQFTDLTFRYRPDGPPALEDFNLTVEPGETVGIIGRTGSGKSTLAQLLVRLYDPPPGTIFIDGVDIREIPLAVLRRDIGYAPQEPFLFSMTVAENITFAPGQWSQEAMVAAARAAQIEGDIQRFSEGFATRVGERGVTLSGGQRQRIGLARALLKNPPILVLDDCFSAVDSQTEALILQQLKDWAAHRTVLVIGHRVATVQWADRIVVLDGGRMVEQGTHRDLLARRGQYFRWYRRQRLEEAIASAD